jgi:hypothetical protein
MVDEPLLRNWVACVWLLAYWPNCVSLLCSKARLRGTHRIVGRRVDLLAAGQLGLRGHHRRLVGH